MGKITDDTPVVFIDMKIAQVDENGKELKKEVWSSRSMCPSYTIGLQHVLNVEGKASTMTLQLYHHLDPYASLDEDYFSNPELIKEDNFGLSNNDPSYLITLLCQGYQHIYIRYGYVQEDNETRQLYMLDGAFSSDQYLEMSEWYHMILTNVTSSFTTNGINYTVESVASIIEGTTQNVQDWYSLDSVPEELKKYVSANGTSIPDICNAILKGGHKVSEITWVSESIRPTITEEEAKKQFQTQKGETDLAFLQRLLDSVYYEDTNKVVYEQPTGDGATLHTFCTVKYTNWYFNIIPSDPPTATIGYAQKQYINASNNPVATEVCSSSNKFGNLYYNLMGSTGRTNYNSSKQSSINYKELLEKSGLEYDIKSVEAQGTHVTSDVISLDLSFPIIAGMLNAYKFLTGNATYTNNNGQEIEISTVTAIDGMTPPISQTMEDVKTLKDYTKIANRMIANGSVTIPGTVIPIPLLSLFNLYVVIGNKVDVSSGIYAILGQTNSIQSGVFTTTFDIMKRSSFTGDQTFNMNEEFKAATTTPPTTPPPTTPPAEPTE